MLNLPSNVPGQRELASICDNAKRVAAFCELLAVGVVDDDEAGAQANRLRRALTSGAQLELQVQPEYDPDIHGYIWDL